MRHNADVAAQKTANKLTSRDYSGRRCGPHNLKVTGSNPVPATTISNHSNALRQKWRGVSANRLLRSTIGQQNDPNCDRQGALWLQRALLSQGLGGEDRETAVGLAYPACLLILPKHFSQRRARQVGQSRQGLLAYIDLGGFRQVKPPTATSCRAQKDRRSSGLRIADHEVVTDGDREIVVKYGQQGEPSQSLGQPAAVPCGDSVRDRWLQQHRLRDAALCDPQCLG